MSTYLKEYDDAMLQAAVTAYGATSMRGELALLALDRGRRLTEAGEQLAWLLEKLQELKCEVSELKQLNREWRASHERAMTEMTMLKKSLPQEPEGMSSPGTRTE